MFPVFILGVVYILDEFLEMPSNYYLYVVTNGCIGSLVGLLLTYKFASLNRFECCLFYYIYLA
jgi:hypothetical protein